MISFILGSCSLKKTVPTVTKPETILNQEELIFQSGFEGSSKVIPPGENTDIVGIDKTLSSKNDWVKDLEKDSIAKFSLEYTGGDITKRYADIIPEPGNTKNHVLHFWLNDSWLADAGQTKARVQADIYHIKPGFKEFYQSVRVFLTNDFNTLQDYPEKINWLTISEFWNNEWWIDTEKYGFRISLGVIKKTERHDDLHFVLNSERTGQKSVWWANDHNYKVPIGKWFTLEYYFKEGKKDTGRFFLAVTPDGEKRTVVYDVHDVTCNPDDPNPDGLTGYNPMKLYTSKELVAFMKSKGKTLQIYWDDFKLWKNKKPVY